MVSQVADGLIFAPADHATRERLVEDWPWSVERSGPGWPTDLPCGACGAVGDNVCIFHSWWCSRNGDATSNDEIVCARCGKHTLHVR